MTRLSDKGFQRFLDWYREHALTRYVYPDPDGDIHVTCYESDEQLRDRIERTMGASRMYVIHSYEAVYGETVEYFFSENEIECSR